MRTYGLENFRFTILCSTDNEEILYDLEDYFIRKYDTIIDHGKGYNNNYGGLHGKHSETTKNKIVPIIKKASRSLGKKGAESFAGKKVINLTTGKKYSTLRECAIEEYGDIKAVKQISKVCNPTSNRFSYKGNKYRLLDENDQVIEKVSKKITNVGSYGVTIKETISGKVFNSIEECAAYYNLSTGMVRDRVYKRIKNDKFKGKFNFELIEE